ncbi:MAG: protein phosphatase 2C domain-containing protein [Polyangiales bacterium]
MRIEHAAVTHVGRRSNNEDAFCVAPELGLFVVADGMGGYEGGEVASRVAVDTLRGFYRRNADDDNTTWPFGLEPERSLAENMLSVGIRLADAEVNARKTGRLASMGSTVAALALDGPRVVVGHVGDSRVYRLRGSSITQVTRDHSLHEDMKAAGMSVPPKSQFAHANVITRALGMKGTVKADLRTLDARPGDVFLLCTDGLIETVTDARIREVLLAQSPGDAAATLVREAYDAGGRDNITVVVARVVG